MKFFIWILTFSLLISTGALITENLRLKKIIAKQAEAHDSLVIYCENLKKTQEKIDKAKDIAKQPATIENINKIMGILYDDDKNP